MTESPAGRADVTLPAGRDDAKISFVLWRWVIEARRGIED